MSWIGGITGKWLNLDSTILLQDHSGSSEILGNKDGLDGGVSLQVLHFRAKAPGIDTIHFSYKRPWKKDQAPVKTCIINVTVTE